MKLLIDDKMKKRIIKDVIHDNKVLNYIYKMGYVVLLIAICAILIMIIGDEPLSLGNDMNYILIDYIGRIILLFCIGFFLLIVLHAITYKLASKDLSERKKEVLMVSNSEITYRFQNYNLSYTNVDIVVSMSYCNLDSITYNEETRKLIFRGNIMCRYVGRGENDNSTTYDESIIDSFVIYDYFNPALCKQLKKHGIPIKSIEGVINNGFRKI